MRIVRWIVLVGFVFVMASPSAAQPRRKKPRPATQADIERLEKKLEEQQRVIDKLMRLQQSYLQAMNAIFEGTTPPPPVAPEKPVSEAGSKPAVEKPVVKSEPGAPKRAAAKSPPVVPGRTGGVGTVVGKITGADDAVVYVDGFSAMTKGTASMKQEGKQFIPRVLVVQKGTRVDFPNLDAIFHNVFSVSPDHSFDLGSYRQGETKGVTMSRSGVVTVYCNMHPQMIGHILVVPNANYVRAGKDGFFRLANVPAGSHKIVAWAPNAKPTTVDANVVDGEVVTVELALKKGRAPSHTKKDGMPYGSYER